MIKKVDTKAVDASFDSLFLNMANFNSHNNQVDTPDATVIFGIDWFLCHEGPFAA